MHPTLAKVRQIEALQAIVAKQDEILAKLDQIMPTPPAAKKPAGSSPPAKGTEEK